MESEGQEQGSRADSWSKVSGGEDGVWSAGAPTKVPHISYPWEGGGGGPWLRLPEIGQEGTIERGRWRVRTGAPLLPPACLAAAKTPLALLGLSSQNCALNRPAGEALENALLLSRVSLRTQVLLSARQGRGTGPQDHLSFRNLSLN